MKLISLEIVGFKSFLHRTTLRFDQGVTCIVGPNGCGKSNIVDAVTWVLGERGTKSLRVKEMGDVIFHGSTAKKQVNMAEVTMGLLNDEREYAIKRRIYRDGTNEHPGDGVDDVALAAAVRADDAGHALVKTERCAMEERFETYDFEADKLHAIEERALATLSCTVFFPSISMTSKMPGVTCLPRRATRTG